MTWHLSKAFVEAVKTKSVNKWKPKARLTLVNFGLSISDFEERDGILRMTPSAKKRMRDNHKKKGWIPRTFGEDFGFLHTPTCAMNFTAPSMQRHEGCRNFTKVFGPMRKDIKPEYLEWMMGWPRGWTSNKTTQEDWDTWLEKMRTNTLWDEAPPDWKETALPQTKDSKGETA